MFGNLGTLALGTLEHEHMKLDKGTAPMLCSGMCSVGAEAPAKLRLMASKLNWKLQNLLLKALARCTWSKLTRGWRDSWALRCWPCTSSTGSGCASTCKHGRGKQGVLRSKPQGTQKDKYCLRPVGTCIHPRPLTATRQRNRMHMGTAAQLSMPISSCITEPKEPAAP